MESQFVPYEIALKLKQNGFDEPCFGTYNSFGVFTRSNSEYPLDKNSVQLYDDLWLEAIKPFGHTPDMLCTAPLWQQVIDWLDKKEIFCTADLDISDGLFKWYPKIKTIENYEFKVITLTPRGSKINALTDAIPKALELI
jgi:hypothetical protein